MAKYDITWIMQSYLGDYPGSRSDSDKKFIRAVKSFKAMNEPRSQLVIAADGCKKTEELYYKHFKKDSNIDFIYIDKNTPNMYEGNGISKYYRGIPRQAARGLAEGILTTYMDSDDFLMPNACKSIRNSWYHQNKGDKKYTWAICSAWINNIASLKDTPESTLKKPDGWSPLEDPFKIKGLKSKWQKWKMNEPTKFAQTGTCNLIHTSDCVSRWIDIETFIEGAASEDTIFNQKIRKEGLGFVIDGGYYVICHQTNRWDF